MTPTLIIFMLEICQEENYFFVHQKENRRSLHSKKSSHFNQIGLEVKGRRKMHGGGEVEHGQIVSMGCDAFWVVLPRVHS